MIDAEPLRQEPVLRPDQLNGLPAVCFDADQLLALTAPLWLQDHTIFAVTRPDYSRQASNILLGSDDSYLLATYVVEDGRPGAQRES